MKTKSEGGAVCFLKCFLIFTALYLGAAAVFCICAYMSADPTGNIKIFSLAALLLSGALGGVIFGAKQELAYTASAAVLFSFVFLAVFAATSGKAPGLGNIINCIIYIGISFGCAKYGTRKETRADSDGAEHAGCAERIVEK